MKVTIFSKAHCANCDATKRRLTRFGIKYVEVMMDENESVLAEVMARGHAQAPVVTVEDAKGELVAEWSGLRPDLIKKYLVTNE